jgi:hypothetical protein
MNGKGVVWRGPEVTVVERESSGRTFVSVQVTVFRGERSHYIQLDPRDVGFVAEELAKLAPQALQRQDELIREARERHKQEKESHEKFGVKLGERPDRR